MPCTWLKSKREEIQGLSQVALGCAVERNEKAIQRWENCKPDASKEVPYAALARELKVSEIQLCEDHLRDLLEAGLDGHAERTRRALAQARRARCFPAIDSGPIQACLDACSGTGLPDAIGDRLPRPIGERPLGAQLASWLGANELDAFFGAVSIPLQEAIDRTRGDDAQLAALWRFLIVILQSCAAVDPDIEAGGLYLRHGEDKAWPFRAMIDSAKRLNGMSTVKPHPKEPKYRLDDSRDSTRAVKLSDVTQLSVEGRVQELVREFAATLALDEPTPSVADTQTFAAHCNLVNAALAVENARDSHVFGLWEQGNQESEEVKAGLMSLLPNLRLFDCRDVGGDSTVLRVDRDKLEAWYARYLNELRLRGLPSLSQPPLKTSEESTREEASMKATDNPSIVVNTTVQQGSGNAVAQAAYTATLTQKSSEGATEELARALEQLLDDTRGRKQETKDLRQAARVAQGELEDAGAVSADTKSLLQRAFDHLPAADKLVTTGTKLVDLIGKLPGLSA